MTHRLVISVIVTALAGLLLVSPVAASNNQGLHWGFSIGQRFDYTTSVLWVVNSTTEATQERFYVIVDSLPEIQDDVVDMGDMPETPNSSTYFENGTEMGYPDYKWFALPVGNWSLIINLWLSGFISLEPEEIVDTPLLFGFNSTVQYTDYTSVYTELYQKSTGVLYEYLSAHSSVGRTNLSTRVEISLIESNDPAIALVAGAAVLVVIFVVALVVKRR